MPFPMKIQPLDFQTYRESICNDSAKPVLKSRLRRLFDRQFSSVLLISSAEKPNAGEQQYGKDGGAEFEPSSVCLAKMVQNFIEESNEKQSSAKCGRNRCNCFNGTNNDSSDDEFDISSGFGESIPTSDSCDILKLILYIRILGAQTNRRALATDEWLRVEGCTDVYALGDCATINQRKVMVTLVKVIRNKQTGQSERYGFIEFLSDAAAEKVLQSYNGTTMPNTDQTFRLNWATFSAGERRADTGSDLSIFVGDLASDVTDTVLSEHFASRYPSVMEMNIDGIVVLHGHGMNVLLSKI